MNEASAPLTPRRDVRKSGVEPAYWDIDDVQFHCRIGRSTAWRLVREEGFPAPIVLGKRSLVWPRAEVIAFVEDKRDPSHYTTASATNPPARFTVRANRRRVG